VAFVVVKDQMIGRKKAPNSLPHLRRSDQQCEALGKQSRNQQRDTDDQRSIPRGLQLATIVEAFSLFLPRRLESG
jgi:hypothetical protein